VAQACLRRLLVHHAHAIAASGTRTYALNVDRIDVGSAMITAQDSLSALYVPFGPTGTAP
jgi:hypothetical protein